MSSDHRDLGAGGCPSRLKGYTFISPLSNATDLPAITAISALLRTALSLGGTSLRRRPVRPLIPPHHQNGPSLWSLKRAVDRVHGPGLDEASLAVTRSHSAAGNSHRVRPRYERPRWDLADCAACRTMPRAFAPAKPRTARGPVCRIC